MLKGRASQDTGPCQPCPQVVPGVGAGVLSASWAGLPWYWLSCYSSKRPVGGLLSSFSFFFFPLHGANLFWHHHPLGIDQFVVSGGFTSGVPAQLCELWQAASLPWPHILCRVASAPLCLALHTPLPRQAALPVLRSLHQEAQHRGACPIPVKPTSLLLLLIPWLWAPAAQDLFKFPMAIPLQVPTLTG